ncbi:hypothetical protein E0686_04360 [Deinococcus sp. S9]|nr:hypothetical protein E0686_04360 [Deinococcus sp. S9]
MTLMYGTGLRLREVAGLELNDVNLKDGGVRVEHGRPQGGPDRALADGPAGEEVLSCCKKEPQAFLETAGDQGGPCTTSTIPVLNCAAPIGGIWAGAGPSPTTMGHAGRPRTRFTSTARSSCRFPRRARPAVWATPPLTRSCGTAPGWS